MLYRLASRSALAERQVVVSLTPNGPLRKRLEDAGVPVFDLGLGRLPDPRAIWRLRQILAAETPEVVQGWMYHGDLLASLATALLPQKQLPVLCWGVRCSDMDLSQYGQVLRAVVALCSRLSSYPDAVVANSHAGKIAHKDIGYHPKRFEVIWNGVNADSYQPDPGRRNSVRATLALPPEARVFAHVARVDPMKDHATFLAALEAVPEAHALLIGLGTESLPSHPRALPLGRREDVPHLLAACDSIVCSSAFGEGFPNVLAEGMLSGCIPISTDVGDAALMIGTTGTIVPIGNAPALASAMAKICALPQSTLDQAGQAARSRALKNFTLESVEQAFLTLYKNIISEKLFT